MWRGAKDVVVLCKEETGEGGLCRSKLVGSGAINEDGGLKSNSDDGVVD